MDATRDQKENNREELSDLEDNEKSCLSPQRSSPTYKKMASPILNLPYTTTVPIKDLKKTSPSAIRVPKPFSIESIIGNQDNKPTSRRHQPANIRSNSQTIEEQQQQQRLQEQLPIDEEQEIARIKELVKMQQYLNPISQQLFQQHHQNVPSINFPLNLYANSWFHPLQGLLGGLQHQQTNSLNIDKGSERLCDNNAMNDDTNLHDDRVTSRFDDETTVRERGEDFEEDAGTDGESSRMFLDVGDREDGSVCGSDRDSESGSDVSMSCCSATEAQDLTNGKSGQGLLQSNTKYLFEDNAVTIF